MPLRRQKLDTAAIEKQIAEAQASQQHAREVKEQITAKRPWVESLVSAMRKTQRENGFSHDYEITTLRPNFRKP